MLRGKVTVGQRLFYTVFHLLSGLLELHGLQFFCNGFCLFSGRLFAFLGVDRLEHLSDLLYLGADNLTSVTFADGTSFAYEYDKVGNLTSQTDALGNVTTFEYDALRQLVKTTYPDGSEATNCYDANGNLISTTDAGGNTATAAYDAVGNLLAVTDAMGNTTAYEYDRTGQLTAETLANGGKTQYNYDNMGRVISTVTATGETTGYTYDAAGNLLTVTAPDGGVTVYTYDAMGRLLTETAPGGAVTRYTYDLAGNLVTQTDTSSVPNVTSSPKPAVSRFEQADGLTGGAASPVFLSRQIHGHSAVATSGKSGAAQKNAINRIKQAAANASSKISKASSNSKASSKGGTIFNRTAAKVRETAAQKQATVVAKPSAGVVSLNASHSLSTALPAVMSVTGTQASCSKQETETSWPQATLDFVKDGLLGAGNAFGRNIINGGATILVVVGNTPSVALQLINPGGKDIYEEDRRQWSDFINGVARDLTEGLELTTRSWATDQVRYDAGQIIGDVGTLAAEYAAFLKAAKVVSGAINCWGCDT